MRALKPLGEIVLIGIGMAIIGFLLGKNYSYEKLPPVNESNISGFNSYGTFIIPILDGCPVSFTEDDSNIIEEVKTFKFHRHIRGLFSNEFMVIEYSGFPGDVLMFVNEQMKDCWPDVEVIYDTSLSLTDALEDLIVTSDILNQSVYIKITEGRVEAFYKKMEEYQD